jgi:beta-aspartyl-peptidase (threonine type)
MIVVATSNGLIGIRESMRVLRAGGSALDAVEAGIRLVEANADDHSVGYGGYPNLLGEVELDAAIMEGTELTSGAVGALRGYTHAISIARQVMEKLPHVFLVADGAERFAAEMGFERRDQLTEEARRVWQQRLPRHEAGELLQNLGNRDDIWRLVQIATDPERTRGTVNFLAQDDRGTLCAGVSTSGWAWKYPGRLGDSPIIGAGLYADSRFGAAACTGMGEMAIRAATAHSVVFYLKMGATLEEAGRRAMTDLDDLGGRFLAGMRFIAIDREGRHAGFSNAEDTSYIVMMDEMDEPRQYPRIYVPTKRRWSRE